MAGCREPAPTVTIDGPSGSGKGTISRGLARRLEYFYLDSGALYRLAALSVLQAFVDTADPDACARVAADMDPVFELGDPGGEPCVRLSGQDVTSSLRTEKTGNVASQIAAYPAVREALLERQRAFRRPPGLVADGRDMGTVVFPSAEAKIFLTASAEVRARRRYKQLIGKGLSVSLADLVEEIAERDRRDSSRAVAPLRPAADALVIDSSDMAVADVLDKVQTFALARIST
jgi:cytidylate kinase